MTRYQKIVDAMVKKSRSDLFIAANSIYQCYKTDVYDDHVDIDFSSPGRILYGATLFFLGFMYDYAHLSTDANNHVIGSKTFVTFLVIESDNCTIVSTQLCQAESCIMIKDVSQDYDVSTFFVTE